MSESTNPSQEDSQAMNANVIAEFRSNSGKVGGQFENADLVILRTTGAKTGQERLTPLTYVSDNGRYYVFAAGPYLPNHPAWYFNLVANPRVTLEVGTETFDATARVLEADDRLAIWNRFVTDIPDLPGWQDQAGRVFPIIELTPSSR